jgi:two-component sensor histidine kinase
MDIKLTDFIMGALSSTLICGSAFIYIRYHEKTLEKHKLKELNHRIQNNLCILASVVKMQRRKSQDTNLISSLINIENKIYGITLLYKYLNSNQNIKISSTKYLKELIHHISYCYSKENQSIYITLQCEHIDLDSKKISIIGIILNELITNSYKHAISNKIDICLTQDEYKYKLIYNDYGKKNNTQHSPVGTGILLIETFARSINAKVQFLQQGSMCTIEF